MSKDFRLDVQRTTQTGLPFDFSSLIKPVSRKNGVVYTRRWVVELMLDLAGYTPARDLAHCLAIEPAAGQGAFLLPMIERLISSCQSHRHPLPMLASSLLAYELDASSADQARSAVVDTLGQLGVAQSEAEKLASAWVHTGDYLLEAPRLPAADFVIGNPPYVRLEDINPALQTTYRAMYRTMQGRADLYIAFFEAALRGLKPEGICTFLCADRWMSNRYGAALRELITREFDVEVVLSLHAANAFDQEVSAYPAVTVIRRGTQGMTVHGQLEAQAAQEPTLAPFLSAARAGHIVSPTVPGLQITRVETRETGTRENGGGEHFWPEISAEHLALLHHLEQRFLPLEAAETETKVSIGVATGLDEVFITKDGDLVESSRLLPFALAADTAHGHLNWSHHYLVNPWTRDGLVKLEQFPRLQAYMMQHEERVRNRHTARQHPTQWYRTIDRVNMALLTKPKLYIPDIKDRLHPIIDQGQTYPHHNLYVITSEQWDLEVLGGLLLSDVGHFFVACYATRIRGGYLRFQAQYLRRIRVPRPQDISQAQRATLIMAFQQRDVALATKTALEIYRLPELPGEISR